MSSFSVANTLALRNYYSTHRSLSVKTNRDDISSDKLNYADSLALRRAVKKLGNYQFKSADKSDIEMTIRGFIDTFNYTLDSCKKSTNKSVASAYKNIQKLSSNYQKELENIGITTNSSGYLKLSSSAIENISTTKFANMLGSDSRFMKQLSSYAKQISNHVDLYL